ncbi:hypothetical protein DOTSEDRAFT_157982 [Dothistroma septosporum NZE10]|uniref:FAD synthase n=1 Tax=Dothistroma septosporum (strain NZE10 / CBS 128990) TaxID=675120 RepID=N1PI15_DOTSN|nr:hypothetical protein DOTSEDRAFT_157982 [Dothistroma septosporum NZE10]
MRSDEGTSAKATATPLKKEIKPTQSLAEQCERIHKRVYELLGRQPTTDRIKEVQKQTRISLGVIGEALERYSLDALSFSYNGGKDCLVLLILYLAALHTHATGQHHEPISNGEQHTNGDRPPPTSRAFTLPSELRSVYIVTPNTFPSVTSFVDHSVQTYHLSLTRYSLPMRAAFAGYLSDTPCVRAIFVGTRRNDPHGAKLTYFDRTDHGWPDFMRIHPVIDWQYREIWSFIKELDVEYCELYDRGYTSLGGMDDTHPNPKLRRGKGYAPAFELQEDGEERAGRDFGR